MNNSIFCRDCGDVGQPDFDDDYPEPICSFCGSDHVNDIAELADRYRDILKDRKLQED